MPSDIDLAVFSEHLRSCRCPRAKGGRRNHHTIYGARFFRRYLVEIGVCRPTAVVAAPAEPELVARFKAWLRKHRGASDPTIKLYARDAAWLVTALGDDPSVWEPATIRSFFMDRASDCGHGTVEKLTTSLRAFLRYLAVDGRCRAGLADVVPGYAHWRLADMPRYLTAEQVRRLIAACDGDAGARRRDRAIVLLLARLGLRAGDVAQLRLADIEWQTGSLRVCGKSRTEVRLPLPQDVGDAIAAYLECRPSACRSDRVFLRTIAPYRPFRRGDGISSVVKRIMKRAGIVTPVKGAHTLRHTAATEMLRHGVPLDKIGLVLRHRGIDTTAYYAKADIALLKQVAQPWPEAL
jgi:site-specific recombinase XerD